MYVWLFENEINQTLKVYLLVFSASLLDLVRTQTANAETGFDLMLTDSWWCLFLVFIQYLVQGPAQPHEGVPLGGFW